MGWKVRRSWLRKETMRADLKGLGGHTQVKQRPVKAEKRM